MCKNAVVRNVVDWYGDVAASRGCDEVQQNQRLVAENMTWREHPRFTGSKYDKVLLEKHQDEQDSRNNDCRDCTAIVPGPV